MARLGILDWGIGGVSIYRIIKERAPKAPVTYLSDTRATPYGKMSRDELVSRLNAVIMFLKTRGVTHLAIGCNAASTAICEIEHQGIEITGVIKPAIEMCTKLRPERLGVIGGRRTVMSGVYRRGFAARGISVSQRIAQPLSGLIESGDVESERLRAEAKRILTPIKNSSHILLACTHYPAIKDLLAEYVSPATRFVDPAAEVADIVASWRLKGQGADEFLTTGDVLAMKTAANLAFAVKIDRASHVVI